MYMINLIIIYDVVNIFSMKTYKSSRKLRVGLNWYPGVNWSTTTIGTGPQHFHLWESFHVNMMSVKSSNCTPVHITSAKTYFQRGITFSKMMVMAEIMATLFLCHQSVQFEKKTSLSHTDNRNLTFTGSNQK